MKLREVFGKGTGKYEWSSVWGDDNYAALKTLRDDHYKETGYNDTLYRAEYHECWNFARISSGWDVYMNPLRFRELVKTALKINEKYGFLVYIHSECVGFYDDTYKQPQGMLASEWLAKYPFWTLEEPFCSQVREVLYPEDRDLRHKDSRLKISFYHSIGLFTCYRKKDAVELKRKLDLIKHPSLDVHVEVYRDDTMKIDGSPLWIVFVKPDDRKIDWAGDFKEYWRKA